MKKQKSFKQFKVNEKYNKKVNLELNNKINISTLKTARSSINNFNINGKRTTENPDKNKNFNNMKNIKNLSLKAKINKLILEREKSAKNCQDKYFKKIPHNKNNNDILLAARNFMIPYFDKNSNSEYGSEIYCGTYKNQDNNTCYQMNSINFKQSLNSPPTKYEKIEGNHKYIKKITHSKKKTRMKKSNENNNLDDIDNINDFANKTTNDLDYKKKENITKIKKGTFSFINFIKKSNDNNKDEKICPHKKTNEDEEDKTHIKKNIVDEKTKEPIKKKIIKNIQNIDIGNRTGNNTIREVKRKNNIILLNFRSDKRRFIGDTRLSTSSEKDITEKKTGALKIIELLKSKRNEKIMLKQKEKMENNKYNEQDINIIKNNDNKENDINLCNIEEHKGNDNSNAHVIYDVNDNNNNRDNYVVENDMKKIDDKNVFNNIIEEVKQEKNYIQKIVHRKLIEGIKELKRNNNNYDINNLKYNTKTYKDIIVRTTIDNINSNYNEEQNEDDIYYYRNRNNNISSSFLSSDKNRSNKRYLNINIDDIHNKKRIYEKNKTYNINDNNRNSLDYTNINNKNESSNRVKIKKIKLDKLRSKMQQKTIYYNSNNIDDNKINSNNNLTLNNKKINMNSSPKIYMPKRVSISKRPSIDVHSIPIYNSHSPDFRNKLVLPPTFARNEELVTSTYITNNIKPFNELAILDLENNNSGNKINSISNNINDTINSTSPSNLNSNINRNTILNIKNNSNRNSNNIKNINISMSNFNSSVKIKQILYNKAKVKKLSDTIYTNNNNFSSSRCKTIRYVKKSNNNVIERIDDSKKKENTNKIIKIQEIQFKGISSKSSEKTINNNLDKTEPTNFTVNSPFNKQKQKSFINYRTLLTSDINETQNININSKDNKKDKEKDKDKDKETIINLSQLYSSNNGEDQDDIFSTKKYNTSTSKLGYNCSYDKIINNITGTDDISENSETKIKQIINLLSFEDLLIIEDKFNLLLIVLEKGNKTYEEYFDLWNYFFSSGLKSKIEQILRYFPKEAENVKNFVNYGLIFIMICYDFAVNSISIDIDNNFSLIEIAQIIYTNILIIINVIKNKITSDNTDNYNIRLIELSKIEITIKNKLSNIDNDILFIKEILHNNSNLIMKKVTSIIESNELNNMLNKKYSSDIFKKIKVIEFEEINTFFIENILKEDFLGCSVLASTYIKEKQNFTPALVPYIHLENRKKYTLIVDLDETLIHFTVNNNANEEGVLKLRPGVFTFLEKVGEFYEIILFTEASEAYTKLMMEAFSNNRNNKKYFDYILSRQHCIIVENDFVKDISRIGRPLEKTVIIDNIAQNFKLQKQNGILIKPFLGEDQNDQALIDLIPILVNIARDEIDVKNGLMKYRDEILTKISSNLFRRNKNK